MEHRPIIEPHERILITGAAGFIGARVTCALLRRGFTNLLCLVRASSDTHSLEAAIAENRPPAARVDILRGNLLSEADCLAATEHVSVILHLAAGAGERSFSDAFMNSVVTTKRLLDATLKQGCLKRFVNVSSFAVYSNRQRSRVLNEDSPVDRHPQLRADPYCYAKIKQDELVAEYGRRGLQYVIVRPGTVYGPGKPGIPARVGVSTFGIFLHLGGHNRLPLTYVDNCAEAIVLAGIMPVTSGDIFNVVDDDLPTSSQFLRQYKHRVKWFPSIYLPHAASYLFSRLWESYSHRSEGQLPPVFNAGRWHANWKRTRYSNDKIKSVLGWAPAVGADEGLSRFFESCTHGGTDA